MKRMNVIAVYNPKKTKLLMCKRTKNPYKDLYNFVGGKIDVEDDDNQLKINFDETPLEQ